MNVKLESNPLVSFLVPTYNRMDLLQKCIESILSQTYKNTEIIVIDDASTDGTERLINVEFENKVKYYKNDTKHGVAYSRNLGLNHAYGKYIGLLDSDDLLSEPNSVEIAVKILESDPKISMFASDVYCIDIKGNKIGEKTFFQTTIDHRNIKLKSGIKDFDYVFCHGIHSCGTIFRKDVTKDIGFLNTDYKIAWDDDFFLRVAACGRFRIYYHNTPLASYRIHNNSFSSNSSELYTEKIKARYSIIKSDKHLKKYLGKKFNRRIADQYYCLSHAYAKEDKLFFAFSTALMAVIIYPAIIISFVRNKLAIILDKEP